MKGLFRNMMKTKKVLIIRAEYDQVDYKALNREKKYSSSRLKYLEEKLQSLQNSINQILIFNYRQFFQIIFICIYIINYFNHENPFFSQYIRNISNTTS